MAIVVYRNCNAFINGAEITGQLEELGVDYKVEILDQTVMGNDTRVKRGGLYNGAISGKVYMNEAINLDVVFFQPVVTGLDDTQNPPFENGAQIEDTLLVVYPDGVTVGSNTTGAGYAMKGVLDKFALGAGSKVGQLLMVDFSAQSRGIFG